MEFLMHLKDITIVTMTLFVVIDIVGSVPIILDLKKKARRPSGRESGPGGGDHYDPVRLFRGRDAAFHRDFGQFVRGSRCPDHFLLRDGNDPGDPAF